MGICSKLTKTYKSCTRKRKCGFSAILMQKMEHKFLSVGRSQFIKEIVENCVHRGRNRLSGEIHLPGLLMTLFLSTVEFYTVTLKLERKKRPFKLFS